MRRVVSLLFLLRYKLTRIATGAKPNKIVTLCKGATVEELKQNIDKNNKEKIVIYNGIKNLRMTMYSK